MKISLAQLKPIKGDVVNNLLKHVKAVESAAEADAQAIFFAELSLTGYEPDLVKELCFDIDDPLFDPLQQLSDKRGIIIGAGAPIRSSKGILIGMIIFQPQQSRQLYCKQLLHSDELPYFVNGEKQIFLPVGENIIAPAICYESMQPQHIANASNSGSTIYLSSVAKTAEGIAKAFDYFPDAANKHNMPILMVNSIGAQDNFMATGNSAVWNDKGALLAQLDHSTEALLTFDNATQKSEITLL